MFETSLVGSGGPGTVTLRATLRFPRVARSEPSTEGVPRAVRMWTYVTYSGRAANRQPTPSPASEDQTLSAQRTETE